MDEKRLSLQDVADGISSRFHVFYRSTIWNWLRTPEGVPRRKNYTADVNARLAHLLGINPDMLAGLYDQSNRFSSVPALDHGSRGYIYALRAVFKESSRTWTSAEVLELIDQITAPQRPKIMPVSASCPRFGFCLVNLKNHSPVVRRQK